MTSHHRSKQVYYTLNTIKNSKIKDVQVIIVDDSKTDRLDPNILDSYPFTIDFIEVDPDNKLLEQLKYIV